VTKSCTKCGVKKGLSEFVKRSRNKSGYGNWCKECSNSNRREWVKIKQLKTAPVEKHCYSCGKTQQDYKFYNNISSPDGLHSMCKVCVSEYGKRNKKRFTKQKRFRKYNITEEQYDFLLWSQDNKCACCGNKFDTDTRIDHCHDTGEIRGILCNRCNVGLGMFLDGINRLQKACQYLARSSTVLLEEQNLC